MDRAAEPKPAEVSAVTSDIIVRLRNVIKVYHTGAGGFRAIDGIDLDIRRGEFLGIIGKSGAGKSTLLNLISGVSETTSGEIMCHSGNGAAPVSLSTMNESKLAVWRGLNLGIVYQSFELMPQLSLLKNIMLPQDFLGTYRRRVSEEHALRLLDRVELAEHAYKLPAHTSGGQKQRIAIARALVNDPPLILADEPTGNLDTVTADTIFRIFEDLVDQGKTIVVVTHDNSLAERFSRRVFISDGRLVGAYGRPRALELREDDAADIHSVPLQAIEAVAADNGRRKQAAAVINGQPAISLRNVVKTYVNAAGEFPALKGINLEIGAGQFVSLVGKSGCGKSTLLNLVTGIDHPTSGEVIVGGQHIYAMSESERALWRGRTVGIVFQFFQLLPTLTLLENTMLPMDYCHAFAPNERHDRAMELLRSVGLVQQAHSLPGSVSRGQQQSAAIARAMATDPPIIVADEPTGNLDSRSAEVILRLFGKMARQGKTILLVTHDPSFTRVTDQTVILSDGEMVDDLVARALPLLMHPSMLEATRQSERRCFDAGTTILRQGDDVESVFLIRRGEVDVLLSGPDSPETRLAQLVPGQFFGEVQLLHSSGTIASARAWQAGPVELSLLPKSIVQEALQRRPATARTRTLVERERQAESVTCMRNGRCEHP